MKKLLLLALLSTFSIITSNAQIELLGSVNVNEKYFAPFNLSDGSVKFVYNNKIDITLLNSDFTLYKQIKLDTVFLPNGVNYVTVLVYGKYITDKLFNTTGEIEIPLNLYTYDGKNEVNYFIIIDENGNQLFKKDNSENLEEDEFIKTTGNGSFMVLDSAATKTLVYKLPGKLPEYFSNYQQLSLSNDTLYLTNGGSVYIGKSTSNIQAEVFSDAQNLTAKIFPNPSQAKMYLKYSLPLGENNATSEFYIYSVKGELVYKTTLNKQSATEPLVLNNIAPGAYIYFIKSGENRSETQKLIFK